MNRGASPAVTPPPKRRLWTALGPELVTGASDDDPSGIATYSRVGSQFGLAMLWTMVVSYPLMSGIQEISARVGLVTGRGLAANLRQHFPRAVVHAAIGLLVVANTINIGADIGAMAAALDLVVRGPVLAYTVGFGLVCVLLQVFIPYRRYMAYLRWLTLALLAYVGILFAVDVPWSAVLEATFIPRLAWHRESLTAVVAILGTTISPYLFFWQAADVVEVQRATAGEEPLVKAPEQGAQQLGRMRADTWVGMAASNLVAFFIILTAAITLHDQGIRDIATATDAAEALRPVAGKFAFLLFSLGIIGTGLLAVPVLAGASAYAVGEAQRWCVGLERRPLTAWRFYSVIAVSTLVGVSLNVIHLDPVRALYWSAVINGVVAAPIMIMVMLLASRRKVMGAFRLPLRLRVLGWAATLAMTAASAAMVISMI